MNTKNKQKSIYNSKAKKKSRKIKTTLKLILEKENFRSISSKMEEILNENRKI